MSTKDNKRLVEEFCGHFARSEISDVLAMMADQATWWVNGIPHLFAGSGIKTKSEMAAIWPGLYARLEGALEMTVTGMVAEDDHVAAEVRSHAVTKTGKVYENEYLLLFLIRDGKIVRVKEYTDPMHAVEIFG